MRTGRLNQRVEILSSTTSRGAHGEDEKSWQSFGTRWAAVEPVRGGESFPKDKIDSEMTTVISFRYDSLTRLITPQMRFRHEGTEYEIIGPPVNPNSSNKQLEFNCRMIK